MRNEELFTKGVLQNDWELTLWPEDIPSNHV